MTMIKYFKQLWLGDGVNADRLSHTKFWSNLAYGVGLYKFYMIPVPTPEVWMIVLGVIGAHAGASKWLSLRYSKQEAKDETN